VLVANKRLPKYQFERRVDIFVNVFLADVLTALFGGTYQLVVPEFPLSVTATNTAGTSVGSRSGWRLGGPRVRLRSAKRGDLLSPSRSATNWSRDIAPSSPLSRDRPPRPSGSTKSM
jgi:hypothetical protein